MYRQSPIFLLLTIKLPFSYFMQIWQLFIILRQPVDISVTVFSNTTKLNNYLFILVGLTVTGPVQDPLAVVTLDNWLCMTCHVQHLFSKSISNWLSCQNCCSLFYPKLCSVNHHQSNYNNQYFLCLNALQVLDRYWKEGWYKWGHKRMI